MEKKCYKEKNSHIIEAIEDCVLIAMQVDILFTG